MKVVIVGAGGLVGKEFTRQLSFGAKVLAFTHSDLDITDHQKVRDAIIGEAPDLVINCAVLGVDACEQDPVSAYAVNVAGAENLATAVAVIDARIVQISSNFVFGGNGNNHAVYTSEDVPVPINVYGRTKLAGERAVIAAARRSFIIRTSWVFGPGKSNFFSALPFNLRAAKRVRAITDVWANPTYVKDLVSRISEIVTAGRCMTYHVVNSGICSYYDFALEAARLVETSDAKARALIEPAVSRELGLMAERPRYSPMRCINSEQIGLKALRDWRIALAEYVRDICDPRTD